MTKTVFRAAMQRISDELAKSHSATIELLRNMSLDDRRRHHAHLVLREPSLRAEADEACRCWVKNAAWPALDLDMSVLVWSRCYEAMIFGSWLWTNGFSNRKMTENEFLLLLLIDLWEGWTRQRFQLQKIKQP
jgi:hypothetical protein